MASLRRTGRDVSDPLFLPSIYGQHSSADFTDKRDRSPEAIKSQAQLRNMKSEFLNMR